MKQDILHTLLWLILLVFIAAVETAVATPLVTITLLTARFTKQTLWGQLLLLVVVSLLFSSIFHTSWMLVYGIFLIIPAVSLMRRKAVRQENMPLPLIFVVSIFIVALLFIAAAVQLTLGTILYTVLFAALSYSSLHLVRSRQQRRRLVEWFWVSS